MFFKQVWRNAARNRKGNGLFFGSLVIAIVAFYTLLSLGQQDVMRFLSTMESYAVQKLLLLLPPVYVVSLFFLYFLVYFACKYQTDSRKREFGMYLMLGMKRSRLFAMLMGETLLNSLISLLIGLPVALCLTEGISLLTAKLVGLDIISHSFSVSGSALLWTVCGFVLVQLLSMLFICLKLSRTEPAAFLRSDTQEQQVSVSKAKGTVCFALGVLLLLAAYYLGIFRLKTLSGYVFMALLVCGIAGTFLLYRGLGAFLGRQIRKTSDRAVGLSTFTGRQVQESVFSQHKALAISSLLMLMALACISFGISVGIGRTADSRSTDFTLFGTEAEIQSVLDQEGVQDMVKDSYPMYMNKVNHEYWLDGEKAVDVTDLNRVADMVQEGEGANLSFRLENSGVERVISISSYNRLLRNMGKEELHLGENEVAMYTSISTEEGDIYKIMYQIAQNRPTIGIDGQTYTVVPTVCCESVVADWAVTIYMALVVPDDLYFRMAEEPEPYCTNLQLKDEIVREMGLMQAIQKLDGVISQTGIEYESYLSGIGRNLFYTVAASYLTIYLGVLFLIIANTVIGLKFLIQQRKNKRRYATLLMLGSDTESMCRSARKQIGSFFMLVLSVSLVSSMAAIATLFTSVTRLPLDTLIGKVAAFAGAALAVFALTEVIYIQIVKRAACREICSLDITDRG